MDSPQTNGNGPTADEPGVIPVWHLDLGGDTSLADELEVRRLRLLELDGRTWDEDAA